MGVEMRDIYFIMAAFLIGLTVGVVCGWLGPISGWVGLLPLVSAAICIAMGLADK
jgi:hypothetical protein